MRGWVGGKIEGEFDERDVLKEGVKISRSGKDLVQRKLPQIYNGDPS